MQKMVSEIQSLLQSLQHASQQAASEDKARQERAATEAEEKEAEGAQLQTIVETLLEGFDRMGKQISEGFVKAASLKRSASKGPDGTWSSQVVQ
jgi:hypothetical protein